MASTNSASEGSRRSNVSALLNMGPAGSRPTAGRYRGQWGIDRVLHQRQWWQTQIYTHRAPVNYCSKAFRLLHITALKASTETKTSAIVYRQTIICIIVSLCDFRRVTNSAHCLSISAVVVFQSYLSLFESLIQSDWQRWEGMWLTGLLCGDQSLSGPVEPCSADRRCPVELLMGQTQMELTCNSSYLALEQGPHESRHVCPEANPNEVKWLQFASMVLWDRHQFYVIFITFKFICCWSVNIEIAFISM